MFYAFIFAVLLLKYCFPTGDQYKNIALQILRFFFPSRLQLLLTT